MLFPPKPRLAFHTQNGDRAKNASANAVNGAQWWAHTFTLGMDSPVTWRTVSQSSSSVRGTGRSPILGIRGSAFKGFEKPEGAIGDGTKDVSRFRGGLALEPGLIPEMFDLNRKGPNAFFKESDKERPYLFPFSRCNECDRCCSLACLPA